MPDPYRLGDCLAVLPTLPESSVALIVADPPYHRVKMGEAWDRQWKTDADYLAWVGRLCEAFRRVLKPNGSLYLFASPRMAARVECKVGEAFNVLNSIVWSKADETTHALKYGDDRFRQYVQKSERIIFAEHFGADSAAKGESGWGAKCDELRGFVFASILRYIAGQFDAARLSRREVDDHFGTANVSQYWLQERGFIIPTAEKWAGLQSLRPGHFRREYDDLRREYDDLRREYDDLRREYDDLRRPFSVSADVPHCDVWEFDSPAPRPGKHPCEKPLAMIEHVVRASSRPGDLVLDPFAGSGVTGEACGNLGREFILIEQDERWHRHHARRLGQSATPLFSEAV